MSAEDKRDFDKRYSACFTDFALKTICGAILGGMMGSFFLRGAARWPMFLGGGAGFGFAYNNCERSLNGYLESFNPRPCKIKKTV